MCVFRASGYDTECVGLWSWSLPLGNLRSRENLSCVLEGNNDMVTHSFSAFERRSKGLWYNGSPCWCLFGLPKCSRESYRLVRKRSQDWISVALDLPLPVLHLFPHQKSENYRAGFLTHQRVIKMRKTLRFCSFCPLTERHPQG